MLMLLIYFEFCASAAKHQRCGCKRKRFQNRELCQARSEGFHHAARPVEIADRHGTQLKRFTEPVILSTSSLSLPTEATVVIIVSGATVTVAVFRGKSVQQVGFDVT